MNRRQAVLALTAVATIHFDVLVFAQSGGGPAAIQKPEVREGDRWTYWAMDYFTNLPWYAFQVEVTYAAGDAIVGVIRKGQETPADAAWTSSWNATLSPEGTIFNPNEALLRFPMDVGATYAVTWDTELEQYSSRGGGQLTLSGHHECTIAIKGWEDVVVPAGTFHVLRIEADGSYSRSGTGAFQPVARHKLTIWYAPEINRWVKRTNEYYSNSGKRRWDGEELLRYEPAPR